MAKRTVEVMSCDVEGCDRWWDETTAPRWPCKVCRKDICTYHASELKVTLAGKGMEVDIPLGLLCPECNSIIKSLLFGAEHVVREQLEGLIAQWVRDYASRLEEEKGGNT